MNKLLDKIESSGHILLISESSVGSICSASAIYTYLLQKHKKVSWYCKTKNISGRLSFIPWYEKIRDSLPGSADLAISLDCSNTDGSTLELECESINISSGNSADPETIYKLFKENSIKLNKKMATALYAGLLEEYGGFTGENVNISTYAIMAELIGSGADYSVCNKFITRTLSLAALRLKGAMLSGMTLEFEARVAMFCVSDDVMKSTGAVSEDCELALRESLYLPHVQLGILLKQNSDLTIDCSVRCNAGFDALKIALNFGGSGSMSMAGFNIGRIAALEDIKTEILNLVKKEM